ncbi:hypothetical protein KMC44_gp12 [Ralstonia phage Cimandef]|uniref:Uncharacterized protein n=1 Tax=Ralstonia phage Cimandef TaxID=2759720 RepID=A0A7G5B8M5_9CAUD|nr:hypothetical protein KMC44_gp12 [Ralstonia phage Cimandef]QMV32648.1 hypothetical protein B2_00013 [Ralstonia phage Cimandef]QMV32888.1 hypothetical protein D1_00062 [Ralstonia phage Dimitile]
MGLTKSAEGPVLQGGEDVKQQRLKELLNYDPETGEFKGKATTLVAKVLRFHYHDHRRFSKRIAI